MATISISCEEYVDSPFAKSECEPRQYVSMKRYSKTDHFDKPKVCCSAFSRIFRFQGFLVALIHALTDSGHDSGREIERRIQHFFRDSFFPGVRQALVYSRLTVSDDGDSDADQFLLPFGQ